MNMEEAVEKIMDIMREHITLNVKESKKLEEKIQKILLDYKDIVEDDYADNNYYGSNYSCGC